ncbi:MAG: SIMPL domain-containing protein [Balneolaceae bacterium]
MRFTGSTVLLIFILSISHLQAQSMQGLQGFGLSSLLPSQTTVQATAQVDVPADRVQLQIQMTVTDNTPQRTFELHKEREQALVQLIEEQDIDPSTLRFQPVTIHQVRSQGTNEYRTQQRVSLTLEDFDLYEEIQVYLIRNGFDNFSGQFASSKQSEGEREALNLAIKSAREKADQIADALDLKVVRVHSVEHRSAPSTGNIAVEAALMRSDSGSLMEFEQTIRIESSVEISFTMQSEQ